VAIEKLHNPRHFAASAAKDDERGPTMTKATRAAMTGNATTSGVQGVRGGRRQGSGRRQQWFKLSASACLDLETSHAW
jgi:hypothetical protein